MLVYFSGRFSTRWPPASLCSHATFWAMPTEGRAPFILKLQQRLWSWLLLAWLVFPVHQWSDYCGQGNSVLSLASLESHVTFSDLRLCGGIVPKRMRYFYQKKNKDAGQVESHFCDTHRRGKVEKGCGRREAPVPGREAASSMRACHISW